MSILSRFIPSRSPVVKAAQEQAVQSQNALEIAMEAMGRLELSLEDAGWARMTASADQEFSTEGLKRAAKLCRVVALAHPLVKRGLLLRQAYVFGQGVEIRGRDSEVNEVVQRHLSDPSNIQTLYGDQAQERLERSHGTEGNLFLACFTNPLDGRVQVRSLPFEQITQIITNPEDSSDPWFYRREWTQTTITAEGSIEAKTRVAFYPDLAHWPQSRPRTIQGHRVYWDAPVKHSKVNDLEGWQFGIGDAYAALPWARSYQEFLADWATLVKSLSQFAWQLSGGRPSRTQKARQALQRRGSPIPGNETTAGATVSTSGDVTLEAIPKTGAVIDSESGRPLATMVAAAMGLPSTILMADPGQSGARAVAETLDHPTKLEMQQRQAVWQNIYQDILGYVILQAIKAPQGGLRGTVLRDRFSGKETWELTGDVDPTVEVSFPSLDQTPVDQVIAAITTADSTQKLPPLVTVRLLLQALGVEDVDSIMSRVTDEDGNWIDPMITAGQAAVDAFRRGEA